MDKDRFRRDLGKVEEAYREVARRLGVLPTETIEKETKSAKKKPIIVKKRPALRLSTIKVKKKRK